MQINSAKDLDVYKHAYALAMEIFQLSKRWPAEEKYALIDQVRRSSRSVCSNLREAWAKRRYAAHFISKLTDCDGENSEPIRGLISPVPAAISQPKNSRFQNNWWYAGFNAEESVGFYN